MQAERERRREKGITLLREKFAIRKINNLKKKKRNLILSGTSTVHYKESWINNLATFLIVFRNAQSTRFLILLIFYLKNVKVLFFNALNVLMKLKLEIKG